jgi:hypothetical protein
MALLSDGFRDTRRPSCPSRRRPSSRVALPSEARRAKEGAAARPWAPYRSGSASRAGLASSAAPLPASEPASPTGFAGRGRSRSASCGGHVTPGLHRRCPQSPVRTIGVIPAPAAECAAYAGSRPEPRHSRGSTSRSRAGTVARLPGLPASLPAVSGVEPSGWPATSGRGPCHTRTCLTCPTAPETLFSRSVPDPPLRGGR